MRSSCIAWSKDEPLILIRQSQLKLCDGNHCAAALLSFFEFWHNNRLANKEQAEHANRVAEQHGEDGKQDTSLLVFKNEDALEKGLLGLYGRKTIRVALELIVSKGFISVHKNPNSRYHFDKTHYFLFHPEVVSSQLIEISDEVKIPCREGVITSSSGKNASPCGKNAATREEITSEITDRDLNLGEGTRTRAAETKEETSVDTSDLQNFEERFSAAPSYTCPPQFVPDPAIRTWAATTYPDVDFEAALAAMQVWESPRPVRNWNLKLKSFVQKEPDFRRRETRNPHGLTDKEYRMMQNMAACAGQTEETSDAGRRPTAFLPGPR